MFQRTEVCSWSSAVTRRRTRRSCRPCVRTWSECCVRRTSRNRRTRPAEASVTTHTRSEISLSLGGSSSRINTPNLHRYVKQRKRKHIFIESSRILARLVAASLHAEAHYSVSYLYRESPTMTDCGKDYKTKGDLEFYNEWELIQH